MTQTTKTVRCAIYTRKSTDEGLDQEFNSLDAQREASEAFVKSQKHEGWECLPERYDDGGFTGGNTERPALKQLLEDIESGGIDCVVVYKVDRLSRSLMDFSRIIQIFDKHDVSFVSVTQQFNTSSSMGRLTLNVLLSFAQFEREIISERTRDKMAATRRKGKWTGGPPILGYDIGPDKSGLVINEEEAKQVRFIYEQYIKNPSLMKLLKTLNERGITNKAWVTRKGKPYGGSYFSVHTLRHLLSNVTYAGKVRYRDEIHQGRHQAIIDTSLFDKVQRLLTNEKARRRAAKKSSDALLKGLLRCSHCERAIVPASTRQRNGDLYRYYACSGIHQRGRSSCPTPYLKAQDIEDFLVQQVRKAFPEHRSFKFWEHLNPQERNEFLRTLVTTVNYDSSLQQVTIDYKEQPLPLEKAQ